FNQTVGGLATLNTGAAATKTITNSSVTASTLTVNNAATSTYGATAGYTSVITGNLNLVKNGVGRLVLPANNVSTYTGTTTVNAGQLVVDGSIASATTVNANGVLRGNGTVGAVTVASTSGMLFPGTANYTDATPAFAANQVLTVSGINNVDLSNGKLGILLV